jgi:hypothetical protein
VKRLLSLTAATILALSFAGPAAASTGDNGTGYFWVFDGLNGSGQWSGFGVPSSGGQTILFSGSNAKYTGNCPDITGCKYMNNTISSVKLSCGTAASTFGQYDSVRLYNLDTPAGSYYNVTTALAPCSNGVRLINLPSAWQNVTGSMVVYNGVG